jgi:crotonobetainyl-CoA:carnitine CoA-transferase CaiB-like acyl-CoA transferase
VAAPGPLDGILVADFSRVLAGPLATMTLADLGADVVKVERPGGGDDTRSWGPPYAQEGATYYLGLNRGKRSVALDLADPGDLTLARELVARADVLVESFRPGTMTRLGLDLEALRREHPRLVTCAISAFGTGEAARVLPGYDLLLQAMGGIMSVTGEPDGRPTKTGTALVDMLCGLFAANGILAALRARDRDGAGQHVEVSLLDTSLAGLLNLASGYLNAGVVPGRMGNDHPSIVPYGTYEAADGPFALAVGSDGLFARLCRELGRPELAEDERFATNTARLHHRDELGEELGAAFATADAADWVARLRAAGVPAGPVNDVAQAFAFAESLELEPVDETDGVRTVRSPVHLDRTPVRVQRRPPRLDEHGEAIRAWLREPRGR